MSRLPTGAVLEQLRHHPGLTAADVAIGLCAPDHGKVRRALEQLRRDGAAECDGTGPRARWFTVGCARETASFEEIELLMRSNRSTI